MASTYFVAQLSPDGSSLLYGSFLGGAGQDRAYAVALDEAGTAVIAGFTNSLGFPTTQGSFQPTYAGGVDDSFIARLQLVPFGITRYGKPSLGCQGSSAIHALDDPVPGSTTFGVACTRAPASANGLLLLGTNGLIAGLPLPVFGTELWVDPSSPLLAVPVIADPSGEHIVRIPLRPSFSGGRFVAQYLWADAACATAPLSASDALHVTVE